MGFDQVKSGKDVPNDINVIIEISAHGEPIKFEVDKDSGCVFVDRFMGTSMHYPCNYGYVPHTIAGDGDPVDVLVVSPFALQPGVVIRCRPIGMLKMEDEGGQDAKVLAVPVSKLTPLYGCVGRQWLTTRSRRTAAPLLNSSVRHNKGESRCLLSTRP